MDDDMAQRGHDGQPGDVKSFKEFWGTQNLRSTGPHFRMRKVARQISGLAQGGECDLLDVGCGPGTLESLLPPSVHYHGIDIAISQPADNLLEIDIVDGPIRFRDMTFDFVVAQAMFEYVGEFQSEKFCEIAGLLKENGKFVLTYRNFDHWQREVAWPSSNVRPAANFRADLARYFRIERSFPVSHNWSHSQPRRRMLAASQAHINVNIPIISPVLTVDYLYVCSPLSPGTR